jgi:hypothetical protein
VGQFPGSVAVADLNADGRPDLAVANEESNNVSVLLGNRNAATHFLVSAPASAVAGASFSVSVTALTAGNQLDPLFRDTVHFTSTDSVAVLPADYTFTPDDSGSHTFSVTLKKAGSQTITATDTTNSAVSSAQASVTVSAAAARKLHLKPSTTTPTAGAKFRLTVTARDAFGNTATGYRGTVTLSDSVGNASLPGNYTFTAADMGVHTFNVTLNTVGPQTLTAQDTAHSTIVGSVNVTVQAVADLFAAGGLFLSRRDRPTQVDLDAFLQLSKWCLFPAHLLDQVAFDITDLPGEIVSGSWL